MRRVCMETDRRLHWVMANRTPRGEIPRVGEMIGGLAEGALRRDRKQRTQLASLLADCVDQEFRRHCRIGDLNHGTLIIEVDEPGLISILRARWSSKIESALRRGGAKTGTGRVLFRFGRCGDRMPVIASGMGDRHG